MLEIRNTWFRYVKGEFTLKNINLKLSEGEVAAVIGPNGSGKTTLLLIASGLLKPDKGEVLFQGKPLIKQLPRARAKIGIVFQDPDDQLFNSTVYDEIAFALRQLRLNEEAVDLHVRNIASKFGIMEILNRPPYKLSEGEKKIVALASVLVYKPEILMLDEPTANISYKYVEKIKQIINEMKSTGKAILITSHNVEFVAEIADRVYILNHGEIIAEGRSEEILTNEGILEMAEMEMPIATQISKALKINSNGKHPLTATELIITLNSTPNSSDAILPTINVTPAEPSPDMIISSIFLLIDRFADMPIINPVSANAVAAKRSDVMIAINIGKPRKYGRSGTKAPNA